MSGACTTCGDLAERAAIGRPGDYFEILDEMRRRLADGRLDLVDTSVPLADIRAGAPWPADILCHRVACPACGARFSLHVDSFHGGGEWRREPA